MSKLQCNKCNYEFDNEELPNRCPYCAAEDTIIPFKTAQDWVNDSKL